MICLQALTKNYPTPAGELCALHGIDLEIDAGVLVAVVGRSGSGKSTLLNVIGGIDRPSSGDVSVGGTALQRLNESRLAAWRGRTVGFVFQFYQLLPTLTAAENVMLPMDFSGRVPARQRRQRALELLDRVAVAEQADRLPSTLSGGQQQRVAIARALANDPPVVLRRRAHRQPRFGDRRRGARALSRDGALGHDGRDRHARARHRARRRPDRRARRRDHSMTTPWRKLIRDFWRERTRTVLVVLAIATGIAAFTTVLASYAILVRELNRGYLATHPASATLRTDAVDDRLLGAIASDPDVLDAEARRSVSGLIKVGPAEWRTLTLFAIQDFRSIRIAKLVPERGGWPPAAGEMLIERDALQVARARIGDTATIRLGTGEERSLNLAGTVPDVGQAQARTENTVSGYVTVETLAQ